MSLKQEASHSVVLVWYGLLVAAIIAVVVVAYTALGGTILPWQMAIEREAVKNSHQYIEAKRGVLIKLADEYEAATTDIERYKAGDPKKFGEVVAGLQNQRVTILAKIREESKLIPESEVPDIVKKHLR